MVAPQKPRYCEICDGRSFLTLAKEQSKVRKPNTMIDVSGFGVKKPVPKSSKATPTRQPRSKPPLPPPPKPPAAKRSSSPTSQTPRSRTKSPHRASRQMDSSMMNLASKPAVSFDSYLLSTTPKVRTYKRTQKKELPMGIILSILLLLSGLFGIFSLFWLWSRQFDTREFQKVVLKENFSQSKGWYLTKGAKIKDGGLFQQQSLAKHYGTSIWNGQTFTDVDFSADVKKVNGPDNVPFGLVTRIGGDNYQDFYYLFIAGNGTWIMGKHSDDRWQKRGKWQKSQVIYTEDQATNRLRLVCKGNLIIAYINGKKVGHFRDKSHSSGRIAVTSMRGSGNSVAVYFDNVIAKVKP